MDIIVPVLNYRACAALRLCRSGRNQSQCSDSEKVQGCGWKFLSDNKHARFSVMQHGSLLVHNVQ